MSLYRELLAASLEAESRAHPQGAARLGELLATLLAAGAHLEDSSPCGEDDNVVRRLAYDVALVRLHLAKGGYVDLRDFDDPEGARFFIRRDLACRGIDLDHIAEVADVA
ncbi:MAG TPA: hypothetical protein VMD59_08315 [Acidimicrobiales bacterium]|nr:hypothetical protein [Acidimicrobiales bacterium]